MTQLLQAVMGFAVKMFPCVLSAEGSSNASRSQTLCCSSKCVPLHSFPQLPGEDSGTTPDSSEEKEEKSKESGLHCRNPRSSQHQQHSS